MAYVWKDSEDVGKFVGTRRHVPHMRDMFEHALWYVRAMVPQPRHIVDIGCGTGVSGGAMLGGFSDSVRKLTLSDFSEPMLEQARRLYADDARVTVVHGDLAEPGVMARLCADDAPDVVISSLAIHHLPRRRQMTLYAEIFDALAGGGVFVNLEHTASGSKAVEQLYLHRMYEHVARSMNAAGQKTDYQQVKADFQKRQEVNILTPVHVQVDWLREIGFEDADCLFRSFELAVFAGRKP